MASRKGLHWLDEIHDKVTILRLEFQAHSIRPRSRGFGPKRSWPASAAMHNPPQISPRRLGRRSMTGRGIDLDLWVTALALADEAGGAHPRPRHPILTTSEPIKSARREQATGLPCKYPRLARTPIPAVHTELDRKGYEMVAPWFDNVAMVAEAAIEAWRTSTSPLRPGAESVP